MDEPRLVEADTVSLEQVTAAFNRAFEGYLVPLSQTTESLRTMVRTNDIDLAASLVALDAGGAPLGVGLLAIRGERAWVGGLGVAPEWRGCGHGDVLMRTLLRRAQEAGVRHMQLEVLEGNTPAQRLYERLGFVEERPLLIFTGQPVAPHAPATLAENEAVRAVPVSEVLDHFAEMHRFVTPCWQRELASLRHMASGLQAHGLFGSYGLRAYILFNPTASVVALLDAGSRAAEAEDRACQTRLLVESAAAGAPSPTLRAINVPPGDPLGDTMTALGCVVVSRQREMSLSLAE